MKKCKTLKAFGAAFFALCYLLAVSACGGAVADKGGYGGGIVNDATMGGAEMEGGAEIDGGEADGKGEGEIPDESAEDSTEKEPEKKPAGLITAGAWNDNDNYAAWLDLFMQGEETTGKFYNRNQEDYSWGFTSLNRIKVTVKNGENVVAGAKVTAKDEDGKLLFEGVSDANGVAYLFTDKDAGKIEITSGEGTAEAAFTAENRELKVDLETAESKKDIIELMFVVDVTGSMGDELSFLNNEIADVVNRVAAAYAEAQINLALLFYRDHIDKEVFKYYDFVDVTTEEGLKAQQQAIAAQKASGGGDYAEAVEEALAMAVEKQWSDGATTKIIFQILDAPPHSKLSNQTNMRAAVHAAAKKGIRVCPVLCSGADSLTEYVMRQAAIYTGGTFVFVTDDSGIGNAHHDPQLPNVTVEALNSLMVRLINGYHSGEFAEPIDWRQEVKE